MPTPRHCPVYDRLERFAKSEPFVVVSETRHSPAQYAIFPRRVCICSTPYLAPSVGASSRRSGISNAIWLDVPIEPSIRLFYLSRSPGCFLFRGRYLLNIYALPGGAHASLPCARPIRLLRGSLERKISRVGFVFTSHFSPFVLVPAFFARRQGNNRLSLVSDGHREREFAFSSSPLRPSIRPSLPPPVRESRLTQRRDRFSVRDLRTRYTVCVYKMKGTL